KRRTGEKKRQAAAPADSRREKLAVAAGVLTLGLVAFSGESLNHERLGNNRALHRHRHSAAGEWIDDPGGIADKKDALLHGGFPAEDDRIRGEEVVLRRLVARVHRIELRLFAPDLIDERLPSALVAGKARDVDETADVRLPVLDRRDAEVAAIEG